MFSGCTVLPGNKEIEFGSSNQEASPSVGKYTGSFSAMFMHGSVSLQLCFGGVDISEGPGCHFL